MQVIKLLVVFAMMMSVLAIAYVAYVAYSTINMAFQMTKDARDVIAKAMEETRNSAAKAMEEARLIAAKATEEAFMSAARAMQQMRDASKHGTAHDHHQARDTSVSNPGAQICYMRVGNSFVLGSDIYGDGGSSAAVYPVWADPAPVDIEQPDA